MRASAACASAAGRVRAIGITFLVWRGVAPREESGMNASPLIKGSARFLRFIESFIVPAENLSKHPGVVFNPVLPESTSG